MNTEIIETEQNTTFGDELKTVASNVKSKANDKLGTVEEKVKESPTKAILVAFGAGYCLNRLPVTGLLAFPLRLTAILAKPTLLALGAAKAYEIVEKQSRK